MVERSLDRLGRKEKGLIARKELLDGRLGEVMVADGLGGRRRRRLTEGRMDEREERLRLLRQKKDRLAYAVERLSLQAQQRERQLRKSMAAQE